VKPETAQEIRQRWTATRNQLVSGPTENAEILAPQYRLDFAMPARNGPAHRADVRRALAHALDRTSITEVVTAGLSVVADSVIAPNHAYRAALAPSIPQLSYDPARAQRMLAEAGWLRTGSGPLIHNATGDHFELPLWARPLSGGEQQLLMMHDNFRSLGIESSVNLITSTQASDREFEATRPGMSTTKPGVSRWMEDGLHSQAIPSPADRWSGLNKFGYADVRQDALADRWASAIEPTEEIAILRDMMSIVIGEAVLIPIYWYVNTTLALDGVSVSDGRYQTIAFNEWTRE
jgi:peptide/nickel transport system substrate-binding protein